jgi:hypothetical protein
MASLPGTGSLPGSLPPLPDELEAPAPAEVALDVEAPVVDDGESPEPPQPREKAIVARQTVSG